MSRLAKNSICCQGLEFLEGEVKEMRCRTKRSKVLLRFPLLYKEPRISTFDLKIIESLLIISHKINST